MAIKASLTMNWSLTRDHACAPEKSQNSEGSRFATKKSHVVAVTWLDTIRWKKERKRNAEENPKLKLF